MSDVAAAAAAMNVPEPLVQRSAEARAKATGASVDEVLTAWAGGASAPVASAPAAPAEPEPAAEASAPTETPAPAAPEPEPAPAAAPAAAPVAVAVMEEPEREPVEAVSLRLRSRVGGRLGLLYGLLASVFLMVFTAPWLLARSGPMPDSTGFAFTVVPGWVIVGSALIGVVIGLVGAGVVRMVSGWVDPGMRLVSSHRVTLVLGAIAGAGVGALIGAIVVGSGQADSLDETVVLVPMLAAILWTLLGWLAGGRLIGSLVHVVGVPDGLEADEVSEGDTVRGRLGAAYSLPLLAAISLLSVVLPAAWVFIQFPDWAPFVAIFIAGAILGFAGLSAARPGMKITTPEFLVAAAGVGVVIIIVISVLFAQGGPKGHGGEEGTAETGGSAAVTSTVLF